MNYGNSRILVVGCDDVLVAVMLEVVKRGNVCRHQM
jgi:hypothetical protein